MADAARGGALTPAAPLLPPGAPQQPQWPDREQVEAVRGELAGRPGLVTEEECDDLTKALALAGTGTQVLHAGDCAERFADSGSATVARKVAQLDALADLLRAATGRPAVRIGRLAGQYGKPRSAAWETLPNGRRLPVYRGDAVNDPTPEPSARRPDPRRLLAAYWHSGRTVAGLRATWAGRPAAERVFASHEALLLDYEAPLLRMGWRRYSASAHLLWVGDRTRQLDGPHVALLASISNPVAVKVGPGAPPEEIAALCRTLNPRRVPGRLTLITRLGAGRVHELLPPLVAAVAATGVPVLWLCDPMHGNTLRTRDGGKTRPVEWIEQEVAGFVAVLRSAGVAPNGLHLETTADEVTECYAGPAARACAARLPRYRSACDPRLDAEQARQIVAGYAALLRAARQDSEREVTGCGR
ncbi:Phospho-2-dehydro-3-deoxyheptonate aldolase [Micromonospora sp. MH33]|uniref:3-deoxy-7-phosphoheptulonate synthase n=1 Tax=Micromonospora sp. MH33 TaxID=1945509 RepID=UPI000D14B6D9|nr:3-deoxy-7-phosphoheptulonate synthase [Micromonospora sp. MH33]PSK65691.1 Phospho-2-dehydro-3-deoxyheptonate aldolase [Micromonospora sp. MH33]